MREGWACKGYTGCVEMCKTQVNLNFFKKMAKG